MGDSAEWRRLSRHERVVSIRERTIRHECEVAKRSLAHVQLKSKSLQQFGERIEQLPGKASNICKKTRDFLSRLEEAKVTFQSKEADLTKELSQKMMRYKSVERRLVELGVMRLKEKEKIKEVLEQERLDEVIPHSESNNGSTLVIPMQNIQPVALSVFPPQEHSAGTPQERRSPPIDSFKQDMQGNQPAKVVLVETGGGVIRVESREVSVVTQYGLDTKVKIRANTTALQRALDAKAGEIKDALAEISVAAEVDGGTSRLLTGQPTAR